MPAYRQTTYYKPTTRTLRGVIKRPYRSGGGAGGGAAMQVITTGLAPLRTGGFFGPRRTMQEKKAIDLAQADYGMDTTGSVTLLNGVATGTDFTDRIGRKIITRSVAVRGIIIPAAANIGGQKGRLIIVQDNQVNGAAPAVTDVLKTANANAQLNLNNRDRFRVLVDREFVIGQLSNIATQSVAGSPTIGKCKVFKATRIETIFQGTTAAVASIASGAIWMVTIGTQAAGSGLTFSGTTRVRFIDS